MKYQSLLLLSTILLLLRPAFTQVTNCGYTDANSKCQLCNTGFGLSPDKLTCMDNKASGNVPYCRLYKNDPANQGKFLCDICNCEYAFFQSQQMCVPNDFFGVQGCHNYASFGVCQECRWNWQTNYQIPQDGTFTTYQAYMNTDLGLSNDALTCKKNSGKSQYCFQYDTGDTKCKTCQLLLPIYPSDQPTARQAIVKTINEATQSYCLNFYFINQELLNINSNPSWTCVKPDSDSDANPSYIILSVNKQYLDRIDYAEKKTVNNAQVDKNIFRGCFKDASGGCDSATDTTDDGSNKNYNWALWRSTVKAAGSSLTQRYVVQCLKCSSGKVLLNDGTGTKCVTTTKNCQSADSATALAPGPGSNQDYSCATCNTYEFQFTVASPQGTEAKVQCRPIYYCTTQNPQNSGSWERKCGTCNSQFRTDSNKVCNLNLWRKTTVTAQDGTQADTIVKLAVSTYAGCLAENDNNNCNACDTNLGFVGTVNGQSPWCTCKADTATKYSEISISSIWWPVNPLTCYKKFDANSDNCIDYMDMTHCKRCKVRSTLTILGMCEVPTDNNLDVNCESWYYNNLNQAICKQCKKGFGIIVGFFSSRTTADTPPVTFDSTFNGKCTANADATIAKYYIKDCIKYKYSKVIKDGTQPNNNNDPSPSDSTYHLYQLDWTNTNNNNGLTCEVCRPGYSPNAEGIACAADTKYFEETSQGTLGCDYYSSLDECGCVSTKTAVFTSLTTRDQICLTTTSLIANCIVYNAAGTQCTQCFNSYLKTTTANQVTTTSCVADQASSDGAPADDSKCPEHPQYPQLYTNNDAYADSYYIAAVTTPATPATCKFDKKVSVAIQHCLVYADPAANPLVCSKCRPGYGTYNAPQWDKCANNDNGCVKDQCTPTVAVANCKLSTVDTATPPNSVCIACDPRHIPVRDGNYKIIFCQSPEDSQTLGPNNAALVIGTPHPACIQMLAPVTDNWKVNVYSCGKCQLPFVQVKVGVYVDNNFAEQSIYSCDYPKVDRCIIATKYDKDSLKCTGCQWPFVLNYNAQTCQMEGCQTINAANPNKCDKCLTYDSTDTILQNLQISYYLNPSTATTFPLYCVRHTYVDKCIKYDPLNNACLKCDDANNYFYDSTNKVCKLCNDPKSAKTVSGGNCVLWTSYSPNCQVYDVANGKCTTCNNNYFSIQNQKKNLDDCKDSTNTNCNLWQLDSSNNPFCIQCTSNSFAFSSDRKTCIAISGTTDKCYQLDSSGTKCAICQFGYKMLSDTACKDATTFTLFSDTTRFTFCTQFNIDSTGDVTKALCSKCDTTNSVFVAYPDSKATVGYCLPGCKTLSLYSNFRCSACYPGFGLNNVDSSSGGYCISDGSIKFTKLLPATYTTLIDQVYVAADANAVQKCAQYDQQILSNSGKCIRCHSGYIAQEATSPVCIPNIGACSSIGCNYLQTSAISEQQLCLTKFTGSAAYGQNALPAGLGSLTGCMILDTVAGRFFDYNSQTKKCDFYTNPISATPNDGSGLPSGPTNLGTTGNDGGIAPPIPPVTPSSPSSVTPSSNSNTTSASFLTIGLETLLVIIFGMLAYLA